MTTRSRFTLPGLALGAALLAAAVTLVFAPHRPHGLVTFALVAYTATPQGALHMETLDSGLSPTDCAFALGAAVRLPAAAGEVLITCEAETGLNRALTTRGV